MTRSLCLGFGLLLAILALAIGPWKLEQGRFRLTTDSFSYANAAWHLAEGRGLVLSQVDTRRSTDPENLILRPLTQWPLLYPALVSVPVAVGEKLDVAAWRVNYLCVIAALGLALWLVLRHVPLHWAPVSGILLGSAPALTPIAMMAWSEGAALCCLLGAHLVLDQALQRRQAAPSALPPVGALAAWTIFGFLSRYAFLYMLPGLLLGLWGATPKGERLRATALYLGLTAAGVLPWLLRNWWLAGSVEGKEARLSQLPLKAHLTEICWQLFGRDLPGQGHLAVLLLLFMLALILNAAWPALREQGRHQRVLLLPAAALLQIAGLAFVASQRFFDPVSFRFLAPATLLLLITGIILAAEYLERGELPLAYRMWGWLLAFPLLWVEFRGIQPQQQVVAVWLLLLISEGLARVGPVLRQRAIGWLMLVAMLGFHLYAHQRAPLPLPAQARHGHIAAWLRAHVPPGTVYAGTRAARDLLIEAPEYVQLIGVSATVDQPERWLTAADLRGLQEQYGLRYLIFPGPPSPIGAMRYGPLIEHLASYPDPHPAWGQVLHRGRFRIIELADPLPENAPIPSLRTSREVLAGDGEQ